MGIAICSVIAFLFIRAYIQVSIEKSNNEKIKNGSLVRLSTGELKDPKKLSHSDLSLLPSYIYLSEHGAKYGYRNIRLMSVNELQKAMELVSQKEYEEKKKKIREEEEKKLIQLEIERENFTKALEESKRRRKEERFMNLKMNIAFEITGSLESQKEGLYMILCLETNEYYIGSSTNMFKRKQQHLSALKNRKHHSYKLQKAFDQFGEGKFKFYCLNFVRSKSLSILLNPDPTQQEIDKDRKKDLKSAEQSFINSFLPDFNVENDVSGRRFWEDMY